MKTKNSKRLWLQFDRVLAQDLIKQFGILLAVLFVTFLLSFALLHISGCRWQDFCCNKNLQEWLLPLYLLIDTNALNSLYTGNVHGWALFASTVVYVVGVFIFNGMIISVMTNAIDKRIEYHREGLIHYLQSGHYIVMGFDDMVPSIITSISERDADAYVLLLTSYEVSKVREKLKKSLSAQQMKRVIINYGHRTSVDAYKEIHLEAAEQVFIVGNRTRPAHDAINVECVDSICRYLGQPAIQQYPQRITCVFEDLDTYAAFKTSEIFNEVRALNIEFVPYNFFTNWAKQVFVKRCHRDLDNPERPIISYPAVYGKGITPEDDRFVHLVFVGTTNFAVAFAMEAANVLHFPNFNRDHRLRTRITFIDLNADKEMPLFITRNRHFFEVQSYYYQDLSADSPTGSSDRIPCTYFNAANGYGAADRDFLDVEFEFIKGNAFSAPVQQLISQWASSDEQYLSVFLAMADQRENFVLGMNMPDDIYDREVPVFIRQDRSDNFVTNLRETDLLEKNFLPYSTVDADGNLQQQKRHARYAHIYPFGMNETAYSADEHSLRRAKLINYLYETADYATNKFPGVLTLNAIPEEQIWADANDYWKKLSVALKWSNLYNAYTIRTKLASLRAMRGLDVNDESRDMQPLTEYEVEQMAIVEHNRWNVEKLLMGYRKARKNEDKYLHPAADGQLSKNKKLFIHHDLRPYEQLDIIRELDREFSRYIPWILKMTEK